MLIYIHGFNSSPASFKARLVERRLQEEGRGAEYRCPALPPSPHAAMELLTSIVHSAKTPPALIGSSLGGFYATWLAERFELAAVLVNPAVRPYELLQQYVGRQKNIYTGVEYELTTAAVDELRAYEPAERVRGRYLLLARTGDEVLDTTQAQQWYQGHAQIIVGGGDHGFSDFANYLDIVLASLR